MGRYRSPRFIVGTFWPATSPLILNPWVLAGVVTERVKEAHQNKSAPMMMLFPGNQFLILYVVIHLISAVFFHKLQNLYLQ